jgi:hypothetical protein
LLWFNRKLKLSVRLKLRRKLQKFLKLLLKLPPMLKLKQNLHLLKRLKRQKLKSSLKKLHERAMNAETTAVETGKEEETETTETTEEEETADPEVITVAETMSSLAKDANTSPKTEKENLSPNREERAVLILSPNSESSEGKKSESWKMRASLSLESPSLRQRIQRR